MIDCDVHCAPGSWDALHPYVSSAWRRYIENSSHALTNLAVAYPPMMPTTARPDARASGRPTPPTTYDELKETVLDRSNASHVVLNCLAIYEMYRNPYFQAGMARCLNDWMCAEWLDRDERLRASLVVPWTDAAGAVAEVERVGGDPRFVQVLLPVRSDARWGHKANHALYAAAAERGLAIALHAWGPGHAPTPTGFAATYFEDYLSNATVVQHQLLSFIAEGVFEHTPDLRVVLVECGFTWLPSMLWRMDREWKGVWTEIPWVKERPSHYVRQNMRATIEPAHLGTATADEISELVDMIGHEWLMYASDYPHDHGPSAQRLLDALSADDREAVLAGNARTLYLLNGVETA
jgi:predicted TIM-barrel fold metal-dependent hydrolase